MGVAAVHKMRGKVIVQDEDTSQYFGMPSAAAKTGVADLVLPLQEIAAALEALVKPL